MKNLTDQNTKILIGNPGCGKTTALIQLMMEEVKKGVPLQKIGFGSFSVAAIDEAKMRALEALISAQKISENSKGFTKELSNFKTLHAMAFRLLGLSPDNLMNDFKMADFGRLVGLTFSSINNDGNDPTKRTLLQRQTLGDKILHIISVANLYDKSIRDYVATIADQIPANVSVAYIEDIASRYRDFKILNNVFDYTDMLVMAKTADLVTPELEVYFLDEAQDLSTLQWILVDRMASTVKNVIIAGDDKQAINTFAGADVTTFLHVPGKVEVLEQSHRIPKSVFRLANKLMSKMEKYRPEGTDWKPREEKGLVKTEREFPWPELQRGGDWLVLTRARYQLDKIAEGLMRRNEDGPILFTIEGGAPVSIELLRLITLIQMYQKTGRIQELVTITDKDTPEQRKYKIEIIKTIKKFVKCKHYAQPWQIDEDFRRMLGKPWPLIFDMPMYKTMYIRKLLPLFKERGDDLFVDAPIRLMTMHKSKGREADNVLVLLDLPAQAREQMFKDDTECKLFYVAITRAKHNLYLVKQNAHQKGFEYFL